MGEYCPKHNYNLFTPEDWSGNDNDAIDFAFIDSGTARMFEFRQRHSLPAAMVAHYSARMHMCPECADEFSSDAVDAKATHDKIDAVRRQLWSNESSSDSGSHAEDAGTCASSEASVMQKITHTYMNLAIEGRFADEVALGRSFATVSNDANSLRIENAVVIGDRNIVIGDNNLIVGDANLCHGDNTRARGAANILIGRGCTNYDTDGRGRVRGAFSVCIRLAPAQRADSGPMLSISAPTVSRYARTGVNDDNDDDDEMRSVKSE